jgi:hypothetical protein
MLRKLLVAALLVIPVPLAAGHSAGAAACKTWNAHSAAQHHKFGGLDIAGGHGYGSGYHSAGYKSPPQPTGAYGDPKRRSAEGGYVQLATGAVVVNVNAFGPSDENDTTHVYDTVAGGCVSVGNIGVGFERCVGTSAAHKPTAWGPWTPCGGY